MKIYSLAFVSSIVLSRCASFPKATPKSLTGDWTGAYSYSNSNTSFKNTHVEFKAHLMQKESRLEGTITEPNTFDNTGSAPQLSARLSEGSILGDRVKFRKTYNGEGGYTHSVDYEGILDPKRQAMTGQWVIGESVGPFSMKRVP